jgi:hypothetical protein
MAPKETLGRQRVVRLGVLGVDLDQDVAAGLGQLQQFVSAVLDGPRSNPN